MDSVKLALTILPNSKAVSAPGHSPNLALHAQLTFPNGGAYASRLWMPTGQIRLRCSVAFGPCLFCSTTPSGY